MNEIHLGQFLELSEIDYQWNGLKPLDWWKQVFGDVPTRLGAGQISRDELKRLCEDVAYSDREALAAILAWGGMRRNHGRRQLANLEATCEIVRRLRAGLLSKYEAYQQFFTQRRTGQLPGMGPAYFTKIIFFCAPPHDGYIMDQWTSKSINLIAGENIVTLTYAGHVSDRNDVQVYGRFCEAVERLATLAGSSPEETEKRLFSRGGRSKGRWRDYVVRTLR